MYEIALQTTKLKNFFWLQGRVIRYYPHRYTISSLQLICLMGFSLEIANIAAFSETMTRKPKLKAQKMN